MPESKNIINRLTGELDEARMRLAEAEEALDAIRNGEIDGLVIDGSEGQRVFSLKGAEEPYRLLIEQMSEGALTLSREGVILYANQTFARLLHTSLECVIGSDLKKLIIPADHPVFSGLMEKVSQESCYGTVFACVADGSTIPLRLGLNRILIAQEQLISVVVTDLTKENKKEEELRRLYAELEKRVEERTANLAASRLEAVNALEELKKSEIRFRSYFDLPLHGIAITSPEKGWLAVNERLCLMFGYSRDEILRMTWVEMTHPDDLTADVELFEHLLAGRIEQYQTEKRFIRKDGNVIWTNLAAGCVRRPDGKVDYFTAVFEDITERKRLEVEKAQIEGQNRQLQKSESLGRMSGAIAHHFNNQLSVVQGYLEMVIGDMPQSDSRAEKLAKAMRAAQKVSEVSGNLLAYLGQRQVKLEPIDLSGLCRISLPVLQAEKPINVLLETDLPSPGPRISADAKQIQQILTNLMINAWEAIGDGAGTVYLSVKTVSPADIPISRRFPVDWCPQEQSYVCMEVSDSGCGIREADMENLFEPFFSTKFTGRGLGLPVVLGIARTHDAVITVENRIGGGSVFRVFFPLSMQVATPLDKQVLEVPKIAAGGTVLLVEDEVALREMTRLALVSFGFTVLQARDGVEAVEIFKKHKNEISCLLCDLTMPRMGGWETIAALRAIRHDLPVILASGYDEASVMAGEHSELPDFFLSKPHEINKLGDIIGKAIDGKF